MSFIPNYTLLADSPARACLIASSRWRSNCANSCRQCLVQFVEQVLVAVAEQFIDAGEAAVLAEGHFVQILLLDRATAGDVVPDHQEPFVSAGR